MVAVVLTGCSGDSSSSAADQPRPSSATTSDDTASHTPTDLQHPCDLVSGRTASRALGEKVTTKVVESKLAARTLDCSYVPAEQDVDAPFLAIQSTPDPVPLDAMIRLYIGVDRLPHHPVDVAGADDAEVILEPEDDLVTVFFKQGFVTHAVILGLGDLERAERIAAQAGGAGGGGEPPGRLSPEGGQQPFGLPARLGVLLLDVGADRDAAAGAEPVGAVAGGRQRPDDHAEVGAAVGREPAERPGVHAARGWPRPPR